MTQVRELEVPRRVAIRWLFTDQDVGLPRILRCGGKRRRVRDESGSFEGLDGLIHLRRERPEVVGLELWALRQELADVRFAVEKEHQLLESGDPLDSSTLRKSGRWCT